MAGEKIGTCCIQQTESGTAIQQTEVLRCDHWHVLLSVIGLANRYTGFDQRGYSKYHDSM